MSSCVGCKFLYVQDMGYSNYTVEEHEVRCAKDRNPNLPADLPWDWHEPSDNWSLTQESRCNLYAEGPLVWFDVDGTDSIESMTNDAEQIEAIKAHRG